MMKTMSEPGPSKRRRRARRPYSPPPSQTRRQAAAPPVKNPGASHSAPMIDSSTAQSQQLESGTGSAVGEMTSDNVSNLNMSNSNNVAMLNNSMSYMFQCFCASPPPVVNTETSVANAWARNSLVTATNSVSSVYNYPIVDKGAGVAETCIKEAMSCEMSALVFHLAVGVKEKI